ncbi:acyl-CoA dehydrogenase family protein [Sphaerisporangium perillae]|uniref:acyl-CoA dehydrogenase family protein n=1 Tax=Sphaerisporangium perillae TaxID=2935860 RepID=UPI00200D9F1B|nr:acyl-CoA dehydrogenase family protein [Sphaerisporangium perillae]
MDARLTDEQHALREAAARLVDDLGPRSVLDLDDPARTAKLEAALAATGWRDLLTDGATAVEVAIVAEELARGLADVPYLEPVLESCREDCAALGTALTCADLVGAMRGALNLAVGYVKVRKQYGRAIGSFQAVQHLLAEALALTEGSASVARHAAWAVHALPPGEAWHAAQIAKVYCSRAALTVCETAIQVHGGIGMTWDCLAHLYLRRALSSIDLFPANLEGIGVGLSRLA